MSVVTGARSYHKFGYETNFGEEQATRDLVAGLDEGLQNLNFGNSQESLPKFGQVNPAIFAYGKNEGSYSMDWMLSNPALFKAIMDSELSSPQPSGLNNAVKEYTFRPSSEVHSLSHEVGVRGTDNHRRVALGSVCTELSLSAEVGNLISGSASFIYGKEKTLATNIPTILPVQSDPVLFPYTFEHAKVAWPSGTTIDKIQSFTISFNAGRELFWGLGSADATDTYPGMLKTTGTITLPMSENDLYESMVLRKKLTSEMTLTFSSGLTDEDEKSMVFSSVGQGLSSHSLNAVKPNEIVMQTIAFEWLDPTIKVRQVEMSQLA